LILFSFAVDAIVPHVASRGSSGVDIAGNCRSRPTVETAVKTGSGK